MSKNKREVFEKVSEHLGFLGYETEIHDDFCIAKSEDEINMVLSMSNNLNYLYCTSRFNLDESITGANKLEILEVVNEMNSETFPICVSLEKADESKKGFNALLFQSITDGEYDKAKFSEFIKVHSLCVKNLIQSEKYNSKILKFS